MKKTFSFIWMFLLVIASLCVNVSTVSAGHGLVTTEISAEERNRIINNIDMEFLTTEPITHAIACFDVSNDGLVALGFNTSPKKTVLIYDSTGTFLYGYSFSSSGSIGLKFVEDDLAVYFARSNLIATFSSKGVCIALENVTSGKENSILQKEMMYSTEKTVDGLVYRLDRDIGIFMQSYSRLIVTDVDEVDQILYDVSTQYNISVVVFCVLFSGFVIIVVCSVINRVKNRYLE